MNIMNDEAAASNTVGSVDVECPKCKRAMERWVVMAPREIKWFDDPHWYQSFIAAEWLIGAFKPKRPAARCHDCGLVLIELKDR